MTPDIARSTNTSQLFGLVEGAGVTANDAADHCEWHGGAAGKCVG